jgi:hypothetical protein
MLPVESHLGFDGYIEFFRYLRGLSQQDNNLVSVIAAANPAICEEAQWGGQDNPIFGFYHKIFLPPLERAECDEMISKLGQGMSVSYTPESLDLIYQNTGGHPFIARQLCSAIIRLFDTRPLLVDKTEVEKGIQEYIFSEAKVFQEIIERLDRDFPTEKEILAVLARTEGPVPFQVLRAQHDITDEDALRHLVGYQLVERLGDTYQIKIGLLRRWLKEKWLDLEG